MAKGARDKIKMVSSAGTGHFYTTTKNKRTTPDKLEMRKYDKVVFPFRLAHARRLSVKPVMVIILPSPRVM